MALPLTPTLLDQILFAMEDQDNFSVINLATRQVEVCADENTCADEAPVLPIPSWSSSDGFKMMREFGDTLRNPIVQAELRAVLDAGQGVFRRFKLVLKPRELLYRQWLRFKRRFMEERIREWIDEWPDVIFEDPAEPVLGLEDGALVSSDFFIREGLPSETGRLQEWDSEACREAAEQVFGVGSERDFSDYFSRGRKFEEGDRFWVAENPQSEWAGVVWVRPWKSTVGGGQVGEVFLWYVDPESRSLGLGTTLLEALRNNLPAAMSLMLVTPWSDRRYDTSLNRLGFVPGGRVWFAAGFLRS